MLVCPLNSPVASSLVPPAAPSHASGDGASCSPAPLSFTGVNEPQNGTGFPAPQPRHPRTSPMPRLIPGARCGFPPPSHAAIREWTRGVLGVPRTAARLWGPFPPCTLG